MFKSRRIIQQRNITWIDNEQLKVGKLSTDDKVIEAYIIKNKLWMCRLGFH
jgi:hypothetical protein